MGPAKGNRELVADPAAQRSWLGKSQVVCVRRPASTQQAGLRGDELEMRTIAVAPRFAQREGAFVDMPSDGIAHAILGWGAYNKGHGDARGEDRRRRGRSSATSLPGRRPRIGVVVPGRLCGGGRE